MPHSGRISLGILPKYRRIVHLTLYIMVLRTLTSGSDPAAFALATVFFLSEFVTTN